MKMKKTDFSILENADKEITEILSEHDKLTSDEKERMYKISRKKYEVDEICENTEKYASDQGKEEYEVKIENYRRKRSAVFAVPAAVILIFAGVAGITARLIPKSEIVMNVEDNTSASEMSKTEETLGSSFTETSSSVTTLSADTITEERKEEQIHLSNMSSSVDWYHDEDSELVSGAFDGKSGMAAVVTSTDEMLSYLSQIYKEDIIEKYRQKYDAAFFDENVLMLNSIFKETGWESGVEIERAYFNYDTIDIDIRETGHEVDVKRRSICLVQVSCNRTIWNNCSVKWNIFS